MKWHECPRCDHKTKNKGDLKKHLANKHNIGVKWHKCPHCNYRNKGKSSVTRHIARKHDIDLKTRNYE